MSMERGEKNRAVACFSERESMGVSSVGETRVSLFVTSRAQAPAPSTRITRLPSGRGTIAWRKESAAFRVRSQFSTRSI